MTPITAKLLKPLINGYPRTTRTPKEPGEFRFCDLKEVPSDPPGIGKVGRLDYACPRGTRGYCGSIVIGNGFKPGAEHGGATWCWNGNVETPDLTPSINCRSGPVDGARFQGETYHGCGWHGHLRNGEFIDA